MRFKLPLLSELILGLGAAMLFAPNSGLAQAGNKLSAPIWPDNGNIPKGYAGRKVFLSPDEHSVIIL